MYIYIYIRIYICIYIYTYMCIMVAVVAEVDQNAGICAFINLEDNIYIYIYI